MTCRSRFGGGVLSSGVNSDRLTPILLALLVVVSLAVSAATLTAVRHGPTGESDTDSGVAGTDPSFDLGSPPPIDTSGTDSVFFALLRVLFGVLLVLALLRLGLMVYHEGWRSLVPVLVVAVIVAVVVFVLFHLLSAGGGEAGQRGLLGGDRLSFPSGTPGDSDTTVPTVPQTPLALVVVLAFAFVAAAFVLSRTTGDSPLAQRTSGETATDDTDRDRPEPAAVGAAAGRAANSIDADEALHNAVYDAWKEMTTHLDLPRETTTPGEFAVAAVEIGMAQTDVNELTRLFEATRYGDESVTKQREQRASDALRRIEKKYAEDETDRGEQ